MVRLFPARGTEIYYTRCVCLQWLCTVSTYLSWDQDYLPIWFQVRIDLKKILFEIWKAEIKLKTEQNTRHGGSTYLLTLICWLTLLVQDSTEAYSSPTPAESPSATLSPGPSVHSALWQRASASPASHCISELGDGERKSQVSDCPHEFQNS